MMISTLTWMGLGSVASPKQHGSDKTEMNYKDRHFDIIYIFQVINHIHVIGLLLAAQCQMSLSMSSMPI